MKNRSSNQPMATSQWRSNHPRSIMIHSIKNLILPALFCIASAVSLSAVDAKPQAAATNTNAAPTALNGRIVFVDKKAHAMAIDIKGKLLQINLVPQLKINKSGKPVAPEDLAAGQEVTIVFRETPDRRLDVVSLNIQGSSTPAEAAGRPKPSQAEVPKPQDQSPASPNPANLGATVRSPNH